MFGVLIRKILRDLRSTWLQTLALAFIVFLGVTSYIALLGAYRDLGTSYNHTYQLLSFADITFATYPTDAGIAKTVSEVHGVSSVVSRLIMDVGMVRPGTKGKDEQIRARLIGLPQNSHPTVDDVLVLSGRYFQPGDRKVTLIETHFAETYHLGPGDTVYPIIDGKEEPVKVIGVVASPEYLIVSPDKQEIIPTARTFAVLFMPSDELHKMLALDNTVNNVVVRFKPNASASA
jgi:putative ABC transport system permease protein